MSKHFEYDNIYKFLTSLGLGVIALVAGSPLLLVPSIRPLLLSQDEFSRLSPSAQELTLNLSALLGRVIATYWLLPGLGGLLGGLALWLGLSGWARYQRSLDTKLGIEVELASIELVLKRTETESAEDAARRRFAEGDTDVFEDDDGVAEVEGAQADGPTTPRVPKPSPIGHRGSMEKAIAKRFEERVSDAYDVICNRVMSGVGEIDILLVNRTAPLDYLVEVKSAGFGSRPVRWRETVRRVMRMLVAYKDNTDRLPRGVLIVVAHDGEQAAVAATVQDALSEMRLPKSIIELKVLAPSDIPDFDPRAVVG